MASDKVWDKLLQIKTIGLEENSSDDHHYRYEPTPYPVLEKLADCDLLAEGDTLLDYGCGKGRVGFFLSYRTKATAIGIEYDSRIYEGAVKNSQSAISRAKLEFVLARAEEYAVPPSVNRCYFFNPFSAEILRAVCARIIESWYAHPREIYLFFYYPADEYISYLMTVDELEFYDEIECDDLFEGNDPRERIMIFQLPDYGA